MIEIEEEKGCVYFFKHIGLNPVKIGYSSNSTPLKRFEQFKTYAPFGAELLGFIRSIEAKELETNLHKKYSNKRLNGEWFDISLDEVEKEIEFNQDIQDSLLKSNFQLEWARTFSKNEILSDLNKYVLSLSNLSNKEKIEKVYEKFPKSTAKEVAYSIGVSVRTIYRIIKK